MEVDFFKEIIVPVIGGLGIFLLGLEFMASGIQALSVNKMREWLAKIAGTPIKGVMAGALITGIIQSSTAMTVKAGAPTGAAMVCRRAWADPLQPCTASSKAATARTASAPSGPSLPDHEPASSPITPLTRRSPAPMRSGSDRA